MEVHDFKWWIMNNVFEIVAVMDNLTETYMQPTFIGSLAEAERLFSHQVNSIPLWKENAVDYDLYSLGQFDAETGLINSAVHKICNGRSVLRKDNN